jgi:predicted RNA-binding protein with PIN domain
MSLQFIIDGYNITNHPKFSKSIPKKAADSRAALIQLIRTKKASESPHNKFWVVFDGFPQAALDNSDKGNIMVIFSRTESADERIKKLLELIPSPKNVVVVSDDKEIKFFAKSCGAKSQSVEDFLSLQDRQRTIKSVALEPEITYTQIHKINEELKKLWLS